MPITHRIRADETGKTKIMKLTARRAIIEHCKECVSFNTAEVRRCTAHLCALYPFRTYDTPKSTVDNAL
jgi:hypothetical protein